MRITIKRLKKCPFCGGRAYLEKSHRAFIDGKTTKVAFVRCTVCNARSGRVKISDYGCSSKSQEACDVVADAWNRRYYSELEADDLISIQTSVKKLPSAQSEQHGRVFKGIVVEYPSYNAYPEYEGKPYFSIKYTENGQELIGYGTYKPEVLSEYLKEYFMPSAQPDIVACGDCIHWICHDGRCGYWNHGVKPLDWCCYAERRTNG